ncbi:ABC transporter ATP-binding protein [Paenibacillus sp. J5C_2022]|uniref:ABC transporter ATP-binding protein n=1 Tax=Paenibacillus sp. J5C2022 TaxID=2977129 RepID=UPI0021D32A1E|nr:ABC transporter ATP-binding protein [Paenibacillus sp. J5C2022]MCU6712007.1 ABC transporter ATP-binding protein [Paenibacillus sp. J5C2022]
MSEAFVTIDGIGKTIKKQPVIKDFSLSMNKGQIVALCGGNGAGKSTVLRMVAGIMQPDCGSIRIGGLAWRQDRIRYAEQIGYMPDDYRFSSGMTAMETMTFWAKLKGLSKQSAIERLQQVGLQETGSKPVTSFSKGMRQRVLYAQAQLARPPLLLMDEPTNGLDPYWMDEFVRLVRQAAGQGQTVLFSTHQLQIAASAADRIVFLNEGAVALDGTAEEIREQLGTSEWMPAFSSLYSGADASAPVRSATGAKGG